MAFIAVGNKRIAETNPDLTPYALQEDVNNEFENVVYKTDIAKAIDVDSTDDEVASAKAVYSELEAKADKDYGVENKGKMLVVGEDGTIVPDEPTLSTVAMTKNAWQIYDKSKLKDGQEVIITDDDDATGVIDDSATRGDATWSSSKISDSLVDNIGDLSELKTEEKSNVVGAINELAESGGGGSDDYSTEEKVIGKWIDGKKIYRRVIIRSNSQTMSSSWANLFELSNAESIINLRTYSDGFIESRNILFWRLYNGYIQGYSTVPAVTVRNFIVEYTKTTD